jgi:hypothetical protein
MRDEEIDLSEIPEISAEQFAKAKLRVWGKRVPKGKEAVPISLRHHLAAFYNQLHICQRLDILEGVIIHITTLPRNDCIPLMSDQVP